jgi:RIO kinase 1
MTRDKFKTYGNVFDNYTNRNLFKLISEGMFEGIESPVSIGKEANIFTARTKDKSRVVLKIYRLETCDFNRMFEYIRTDPRFSQIKKSKRKIIFEWAKREFTNLMKARELGIKVPRPLTIKDNIVVMEHIGGKETAPKLKDTHDYDIDDAYNRVIAFMKKLHKGGLVHGDLSEYNILIHRKKPVFIDFSQTTSLRDPNAREWVERDAKNIAAFFMKKKIKTSADQILKSVMS